MEGEEEEEFRFTFHRFSQLRIRVVNKQIPVYFVDKFNPFSLSLSFQLRQKAEHANE